MAPKRSRHQSSVRRSQIPSEQIVPIYEHLSNQEIAQPVSEVITKLEEHLKGSPMTIKISLLHFLARFCGMGQLLPKVDQEDTLLSLGNAIEKAEQSASLMRENLIILESKSKFHKEFIKRIRLFLRTLIGPDLEITSNNTVQFHGAMLSWLRMLTTSKQRKARKASFLFVKLFLEEQIDLFDHYHKEKNSKKAFYVSKNIANYVEQILSERIIDIDDEIRTEAFKLTEKLLLSLEAELMTEVTLQKLYGQLFEQDKKIMEETIDSLSTLKDKCKNPKCLCEFFVDRMPKVMQLSKTTGWVGVKCLRIVGFVNRLKPELRVLTKELLTDAMENYAKENLFYALRASIEVFYLSLYPSLEAVEANSTMVVIEIANLLAQFSSRRIVSTILVQFFQHTSGSFGVFNVDDMFNLLMAEYFTNEHGVSTTLNPRDIGMILVILCEWAMYYKTAFLHARKRKDEIETALNSYNHHILIHSKEIFFEKMTKHGSENADKYLELYACLFTPVTSTLESYLGFVLDKCSALFGEELSSLKMYSQIVKVHSNIEKDGVKILINKALKHQSSEVNVYQLFRVSSLLDQVPIFEIMNDDFLSETIKFFAESKSDKQKIEGLNISFMIHRWLFLELLRSQTKEIAKTYNYCRDKVVMFYVQVLENRQSPTIKLSAFSNLCNILKTISSSEWESTSSSLIKYCYHPPKPYMKSIYDYIYGELFNSADSSMVMDISEMFAMISLDNKQIKRQISEELFQLYEKSWEFTCCSESVRFFSVLIKGEDEIAKIDSRGQQVKMTEELSKLFRDKLNTLLEKYISAEVRSENASKFVFWRLAQGLFHHSRKESIPLLTTCISKLSKMYFKKNRDPEEHKRKLNKLLLFLLEGVTHVKKLKELGDLDIYARLYKTVYRKYQKQRLLRLNQSMLSQITDFPEDQQHIKSFKQALEEIVKSGIRRNKTARKSQVKQQEGEERESDDDSEGQDDDRMEEGDRTVAFERQGAREVMEVEKDQTEIKTVKKSTRRAASKTKPKKRK